MLYSNTIDDLAYVSEAAAQFLATHDMAELPCGSYEIGPDEFVNVMEYDTKARKDACYEAHKKYVDIQMVISGSELIEVAPVTTLSATTDFNEKDDFALYSNEQIGDQYLLVPGKFIAVMPADGHMPSLTPAEAPSHNKKAVFKVLAR